MNSEEKYSFIQSIGSPPAGAYVQKLLLNPSGGDVYIGSRNPSGASLLVKGLVKCKEVEVTLAGWSDHVFADGYSLRTLPEVETYVKENRHLPGVPSEKEVLDKGINLGEMNAILLGKIEELYLHSIEQQKRIEELEKKIQTIK